MDRQWLWFLEPLLLLGILLTGVFSGFTQGLVDFRNGGITFATTADRKIYGSCPFAPVVGTNYVAALFYLPGSDRGAQISEAELAYDSNNLAYAFFRPEGTSLPGVWRNPNNVGNYRVLEGVLPGEGATLQVRVWDGNLAADWPSAVLSGQFLASAPFNYTVPPPTATANLYYMENLRAAAVLIPCRPRLEISRQGNSLILSWEPSGGQLEETVVLKPLSGTTWTPVPPPYFTSEGRVWVTNEITGGDKFYRVRVGP